MQSDSGGEVGEIDVCLVLSLGVITSTISTSYNGVMAVKHDVLHYFTFRQSVWPHCLLFS